METIRFIDQTKDQITVRMSEQMKHVMLSYTDPAPEGFLPVRKILPKPVVDAEHELVFTYKNLGNEVTKEYSVIGLNEKLITIDDYDKAMELYLKKVRSARGYNTREPSDYISSGNERWKTDAQDWIAFRDEVMEYALDVQNKYIAQQPVPSINDFIAGFPTITWTYRNEAK